MSPLVPLVAVLVLSACDLTVSIEAPTRTGTISIDSAAEIGVLDIPQVLVFNQYGVLVYRAIGPDISGDAALRSKPQETTITLSEVVKVVKLDGEHGDFQVDYSVFAFSENGGYCEPCDSVLAAFKDEFSQRVGGSVVFVTVKLDYVAQFGPREP